MTLQKKLLKKSLIKYIFISFIIIIFKLKKDLRSQYRINYKKNKALYRYFFENLDKRFIKVS